MGNPNLQMFREDTPTVEVGTEGNPIDFGTCMAGQATTLAYDILLYNDKDGSADAVLARNIALELIRMEVLESHVSTGLANQAYTLASVPVYSHAILVDGEVWSRVADLADYGQYSKVFTLDLSTGVIVFGDNVHGMIPPTGDNIDITYAPDLASYGKPVVQDSWLSFRSNGVVEEEISVSSELATKISNTSVQVAMYPQITEVVGVWDNSGKTGTNYFTGGTFNATTGIVTLGTELTATTPYIEYSYKIVDDSEASFTSFVQGGLYELTNPIPKKNAKKITLKATIPATAGTNGGINLRIYLKVSYIY